ncbi:MAG: glycosyl transferase family 2 [Peptococcaceae bacterium BRH_c4b]|nr:MAG: glycosyl transferase family 2 [Peptococcaceae bacterium BRH_c4b]
MRGLIIIPAFNEAENIIALLKKINALCLNLEIIVINDASEDNTAALARSIGAKVIDIPINLGIGGAVQTGYLYAYYNDYDVAVQVDGDGQHDPLYIQNLITPIISGQADMVVGSRFIECTGFQSTSLRRFGIKYFEKLIFLLTKKRFSDPTSGFRACNKQVIANFAKYYPDDYPEPETLVTINRKGFRIIEIPVIMKEREGGQSSIKSIKTVYYMLKVTLAILMDVFKKNDEKRYSYHGTKVTAISNNN